MDGKVTIDLKANPENGTELSEAEVGDCVYLRVVDKTGDTLVGTVEQIEPMDESDTGEGGDPEELPVKEKSGGKSYGKSQHAKGILIMLGK